MTDIIVAKIVNTHGLKGAVKVMVEGEDPNRFFPGRKLYVGEDRRPVTVQSFRAKGRFGILCLEEWHSIEIAETFRNAFLYSAEEALPPLSDHVYYVKDLIGLQVVDAAGTQYGRVVDVLSTAANDVYVVQQPDGHLAYIPAVRQIVQDVNLPNGRMTIYPMKGLFDAV